MDRQLVQIIIDNERIIDLLGEPLVFHMPRELDIDTYFKVYRLQSSGITNELVTVLRPLLLDSEGTQILEEDDTLPISIISEVIIAINATLDQVRNQDLDPKGDWKTAQLVTIGAIAKAYGVLPHVVRDTATTYDLMIYDVANTWERYQYEKSQGKVVSQQPSLEDMKAMMIRARGEENND